MGSRVQLHPMSDGTFVFQSPTSTGEVREKLPTLKQWLKTQGKKAIPKRFLVSLVWEPNQWRNYTLQTEKFRVRVSEGDPIFEALQTGLSTLLDMEYALMLEVTDREKGAFQIIGNPQEPGHWNHITDTGHKWVADS